MKWHYEIELTVDTNDADYIHESYGIGDYDDDNEVDQKALAAEILVYQNFEVDDGESDFDLDNYLEDLHKFGLTPTRQNGFASILNQMRKYAEAYSIMG